MNMKRYTAFIAAMDDFHGTAEDLVEAWQNDHPSVYHVDFEVPLGTSDRLVALIARGLFWEDQWSADDTVSTVVEDLTPEDTRPLGDNPADVSIKDHDVFEIENEPYSGLTIYK
jgi:hypothetical protein